MRKRIAKSLTVAVLAASITGATYYNVLADEVTDLQNQKSAAESQLNDLESQLAYILVQMDDVQSKIYDKNDEINQANEDLKAAEEKHNKQREDTKLRIKYMYEDQSASLTEAFLTASDMGDALNKTEYVQKVYDYDRTKLEEMAETAKQINDLKTSLENDKNELQALSDDLTKKQALLYSTIDEQKSKVADFDTQLTAAVEAATKKAEEEQRKRDLAAREAAQKAAAAQTASTSASKDKTASASASASATTTSSSTGSGNLSIAQKVVQIAYAQLGVPYVVAGSSPSGFDCSGLTSYVFKQCGITLKRTSGQQASDGQPVSSLSEALPGDIICYPGHVAIYIGNGQIIHAPTVGDKVKVASATILPITGIRRCW